MADVSLPGLALDSFSPSVAVLAVTHESRDRVGYIRVSINVYGEIAIHIEREDDRMGSVETTEKRTP